jgi:hypothetical protein
MGGCVCGDSRDERVKEEDKLLAEQLIKFLETVGVTCCRMYCFWLFLVLC